MSLCVGAQYEKVRDLAWKNPAALEDKTRTTQTPQCVRLDYHLLSRSLSWC
ncbi:hypothetical protein Mapa_008569 [Marchantia paleacea]|nr:hypothetical protein Mapa_008569 [Marchantia paleacea]